MTDSPPHISGRTGATARVGVAPQHITVEHLRLADPGLAAFVAEAPENERASLVERALRIGLLTLCNAGVSMSADVVRSEFERLYERMEGTQRRAAEALAATLREHFADGDGRLPRTLERFLGDDGALRRLTSDLFNEDRRDSAVGRLNDVLGRYFDGDGSRLAQLLDPTRSGSPLHQFRSEVSDEFRRLSERITSLEEVKRARAEERAHSAAKGVDFEDLLAPVLADLAHGAGDLLDRTGTDAGDAMRSKKGDFVLALNPALTRGLELRVVVEAKNRSVSRQRFQAELAEAKVNRGAALAIAVFTPQAAPSGIAPLQLVGSDVWCVHDPDDDEAVALEAAVRLARVLALGTLRDAAITLDVGEVADALADVAAELQRVQGMKSKLTSIGTVAREVSSALDELRAGVQRHVRRVEDQLRAVDPDRPDALSA